MRLIYVGEGVSKKVWKEVAKITKSGEVVGIYTVKAIDDNGGKHNKKVYHAVVDFSGEDSVLAQKDYDVFASYVSMHLKVTDVYVDQDVVYVAPEDFKSWSGKTGSSSVIKATDFFHKVFGDKLNTIRFGMVIGTEDGLLGILKDMVKQVSRKVAEDKFSVYCEGNVRERLMIVNNSLMEKEPSPNRVYDAHTVNIIVEPLGDVLFVGLTLGGEVRTPLILKHIPLGQIPIRQLKNGQYSGRVFMELLDVIVRALVLASDYGYTDSEIMRKGLTNFEERPKYSRLFLKDGSVIWYDKYSKNNLLEIEKVMNS